MNPAGQPNPSGEPAPAAFAVEDVLFTVFRHKRIILICACVGIVAAVGAFKTTPVIYSSKAKLLVRYVKEERGSVATGTADVRMVDPVEGVLNSEVEILTSLDVAKQVATNIGPNLILAAKGGGDSPQAAAGVVKGGLSVISSRRSAVLVVFFEHPDPEVVQPVLNNLIRTYLTTHVKVRLAPGFNESAFTEQQVELRNQLADVEKQLDTKLRAVRVVDIEMAKRVFNTQIEKISTDLLTARTELAERTRVLQEMAPEFLKTIQTNAPANSGTPGASGTPVPSEKLDDYSLILGQLAELSKRERDSIMQGFTDEHPVVVSLRVKRERLVREKKALEQEYPTLAGSASNSMNTGSAAAGGIDVSVELARVRALSARVAALDDQYNRIQSEAFGLADIEPIIGQLRRQRDDLVRRIEFFSGQLDMDRQGDQAANKITNIEVVETPTPPILNNQRRMKITGGAFGALVVLGLAISFLIDFVLDRTIKRSVDIKRKLRLPVFLAIPDTSWAGRPPMRLPWGNGAGRAGEASAANGMVGHLIEPWEGGHHLYIVNEGLRERLVTYFEIHNLSHKPKLVGVTACEKGSGVSSLAGGLAAALSRTGDGNVLLVDMNNGPGVVQSFYKGKPGRTEEEVMEPVDEPGDEGKTTSLVVAAKGGGSGPSLKGFPKQFSNLVPEAKNYDYIVFDMPPVSPISLTPRLTGHMDLVLLVLESEKTGQHAASRATSLLLEAKANTVAILNKCRRYVPERLSEEL